MSDEPNDMKEPHEHASAAGAPGASGPGEAGYEGEATIGDEGSSAGALSFQDPFGRPAEASGASGSEGEEDHA
jgi:hypothetical protein